MTIEGSKKIREGYEQSLKELLNAIADFIDVTNDCIEYLKENR